MSIHQGDRSSVVLVPHDPRWADLFEAERQRLLACAPDPIIEVHHVGSTVIPGIHAKPVVDLLMVLRCFLSDSEIEAVAAPGYEYRGEYGIPCRQYFSRRSEPAFHVHAFLESHPDVRRMLLFRDYLRAHPDAASDYEALKLRLASEVLDREAYTEAKAEFVRRIDALAARATGET